MSEKEPEPTEAPEDPPEDSGRGANTPPDAEKSEDHSQPVDPEQSRSSDPSNESGEPGDTAEPEAPEKPADAKEPEEAPVDPGRDSAAATSAQPDSRRREKLSALEFASLASIALLLIAATLAFGSMVKSHIAVEETDKPDSAFKGDVRGEYFGLASVDISWREPQATDRVKTGQEFVPYVAIRLASQPAASTAYLKAVIRDAGGAIRGDVTPLRIDDGNFAETATPETGILGTEGFEEGIQFDEYRIGTEFWTVELFEGPSYTGKDWNRLAYLTAGAKLEKSSRRDPN